MKKKGTSDWLKPRLDSPLIPFLLCAAVLLSMLMVHAAGSTVYPGDVNTDRNIDVSDAVLLARFCAEDPEAVVSAEGRQNADVNSDNHISGEDLIMLLQQSRRRQPNPKQQHRNPLPQKQQHRQQPRRRLLRHSPSIRS